MMAWVGGREGVGEWGRPGGVRGGWGGGRSDRHRHARVIREAAAGRGARAPLGHQVELDAESAARLGSPAEDAQTRHNGRDALLLLRQPRAGAERVVWPQLRLVSVMAIARGVPMGSRLGLGLAARLPYGAEDRLE